MGSQIFVGAAILFDRRGPMDSFGKEVTAQGEVVIAGTRRPDGTPRRSFAAHVKV